MMGLEYLILRIRHGLWMRAIAKLKTSNFGDFLRGGCDRSGTEKPFFSIVPSLSITNHHPIQHAQIAPKPP
jgi:hypothetical protein